MGGGVISFFLASLGGGGGVVRCRGVIKEKSPDFRSPEVGISDNLWALYGQYMDLVWATAFHIKPILSTVFIEL